MENMTFQVHHQMKLFGCFLSPRPYLYTNYNSFTKCHGHHCKDPYETTSIESKAPGFFFVAQPDLVMKAVTTHQWLFSSQVCPTKPLYTPICRWYMSVYISDTLPRVPNVSL